MDRIVRPDMSCFQIQHSTIQSWVPAGKRNSYEEYGLILYILARHRFLTKIDTASFLSIYWISLSVSVEPYQRTSTNYPRDYLSLRKLAIRSLLPLYSIVFISIWFRFKSLRFKYIYHRFLAPNERNDFGSNVGLYVV